MSRFTTRQVACPVCQREHELEIATSLNALNHPRFRDEILAGIFQRFVCTECSKVFLVDDPLVYMDFTQRHWICMFPGTWEDRWPECENEPKEAFDKYMTGPHSSPVARSMSEGYVLRTVFGLPALAEKLLCLHHRFDDRWLELLKLRLMQRGEGVLFNPNYRPRLVAVETAVDELVFSLPTAEGIDTLVAPIPILEELMASPTDYSEALLELSKSPYVDMGRLLVAPSS